VSITFWIVTFAAAAAALNASLAFRRFSSSSVHSGERN
jgi:hypothetical protein